MSNSAGVEKFYDEEADKIFKGLHLSPEEQRAGSKQWSPYNCIYVHPETKAKVYVGGQGAANDKKFFVNNNVKGVINCTAEQPNFFEKDTELGISYLRFCVATWEFDKNFDFKSSEKNVEVLRYVDVMLDKVDGFLIEGKSVLIHCLAGAHRAGTTGVIFIMSKMKVKYEEGIKIARSLRRIINPIGRLVFLLEAIDKAVLELNRDGKIPPNSRWFREGESNT